MANKMLGFVLIVVMALATSSNGTNTEESCANIYGVVPASDASLTKTEVKYTGTLQINGTVTGENCADNNGPEALCCCNIPGCTHLCGCRCGTLCVATGGVCICTTRND